MFIVGIRKVFGSYGRKFQTDEDGNDVDIAVVIPKRKQRGRPKKNTTQSGGQMSVTPELYHAFGLL